MENPIQYANGEIAFRGGVFMTRSVRVICREPGNYGLHMIDFVNGKDYRKFYKTERGMKRAWTMFINK